jgi:hypothetical protein
MSDNPLSDLTAVLGGGADGIRSAGQTGSDMLSGILGKSSMGALTDSLTGYIGGNKETVSTLLGLVGAGALGTMKQTAREQKLDSAGLMNLLASQKGEIADAIPADLASKLNGAGLLPADFKAAATRTAAAAKTASPGGGMMKWIVGIVAVLLLLWIAPKFIGGSDEVMTEAAPGLTVAEGVDVGAALTDLTSSLTETLSGITDVSSAQAALEGLTASDNALSDLQTSIGGLGAEGKSAIASLVSGALPSIQSSIEGLLGNSEISAILKPVLDAILNKLVSLAG